MNTRLLSLAVAAMAVGMFAGVSVHESRTLQNRGPQESAIDVAVPPTTDSVSFAISPDGKSIVYSADSEGKYKLWIRSLETGTSRPLPGTDDVFTPLPCWSPDSKSIAYFGGLSFKRIDIETGAIRDLYPAGRFVSGCSWNRDGTILFSARVAPILRISDQGGAALPATPPSPLFYKAPHGLPDGRHFLFYGDGGIFVSEVGGSTPQRLLDSDSGGVYSRSGHLLFVRKGTLYAQPFDPATLALSGTPSVLANNVPVGSMYNPGVSTSAAGDVAYRTGSGRDLRTFKWFDRKGKELSTVGDPMTGTAGSISPSPDGQSVALSRTVAGNADIWLMELATGKLTRVTSDPAEDIFPAWSSDPRSLFFSSLRTGGIEMFQKSLTDESERLVLRRPGTRQARDASRDGRFLLFTNGNGGVLALQLDGNPPAEIPLVTSSDFPQFAPDTRWIAYQSNQSGRMEIYVRQFPTGREQRVSDNGGIQVRWRSDGNELYYLGLDGNLMAVSATLAADNQSFTFGKPTLLFAPQLESNLSLSSASQQYLPSPDGQRFLAATVESTKSPIQLIRNLQTRGDK